MSKLESRYDIYDRDGLRRIYKAVKWLPGGYGWDSAGFIPDRTVKTEGWIVVPTAEDPKDWA